MSDAAFVVDLDGYEGPLDLLLDLARHQKVDLAKISILALADQYLDYLRRATELKLTIAADYLVMAAWLAFLKSRLLIPAGDDDEIDAEELAAELAERLRHLDRIRRAGEDLLKRDRLGSGRFARGAPEGLSLRIESRFRASLFDLLDAYARVSVRSGAEKLVVQPARVFGVEEALARLTAHVRPTEWQNLLSFLPPGLGDDLLYRSAIASSFGASLELARSGKVELRQAAPFAPIYVRTRS